MTDAATTFLCQLTALSRATETTIWACSCCNGINVAGSDINDIDWNDAERVYQRVYEDDDGLWEDRYYPDGVIHLCIHTWDERGFPVWKKEATP